MASQFSNIMRKWISQGSRAFRLLLFLFFCFTLYATPVFSRNYTNSEYIFTNLCGFRESRVNNENFIRGVCPIVLQNGVVLDEGAVPERTITGMVSAFPSVNITTAGSNIPPGWLICDGSVYNIADYQLLFDRIGNIWGDGTVAGGDGVTTFAVPDMRRSFIRGSFQGSHATAASNGGFVPGPSSLTVDRYNFTTGLPENLYSASTGSGGDHSHEFDDFVIPNQTGASTYTTNDGPGGNNRQFVTGIGKDPGVSTSGWDNHAHTIEVDLGGGDAETRPVNYAMVFIIFTGEVP